MENTISYPSYRKYKNNRAYFKILDAQSWEEIQVVGNNYLLHSFQVAILPDRNFLYDMSYDFNQHWEEITAEEYAAVKGKVRV